jgi:phosphatidylethanolamine N-methyltransferase
LGQDARRQRQASYSTQAVYHLYCDVLTNRVLVFRVPTTHDVLSALFHPKHPKSHIDFLNLFLLGSQILIFSITSRSFSRVFFLVYFAFWRAAYDAGLGWVLTQQSKRRWIVREVERRGWLDENKRPKTRAWIRAQLQGKMGKDYSFDVSAVSL